MTSESEPTEQFQSLTDYLKSRQWCRNPNPVRAEKDIRRSPSRALLPRDAESWESSSCDRRILPVFPGSARIRQPLDRKAVPEEYKTAKPAENCSRQRQCETSFQCRRAAGVLQPPSRLRSRAV